MPPQQGPQERQPSQLAQPVVGREHSEPGQGGQCRDHPAEGVAQLAAVPQDAEVELCGLERSEAIAQRQQDRRQGEGAQVSTQ